MSEAIRKRRVLVVTGTRAEFGLLRPVMKAVLDRSGDADGEGGDLELWSWRQGRIWCSLR